MVLFRSPSVSFPTNVKTYSKLTTPADTVDQIIARVNDAGEFDELELVWMLSA